MEAPAVYRRRRWTRGALLGGGGFASAEGAVALAGVINRGDTWLRVMHPISVAAP